MMEGQSRDGEAIVSCCFLDIFVERDGGESRDGGYPSPPTKTL